MFTFRVAAAAVGGGGSGGGDCVTKALKLEIQRKVGGRNVPVSVVPPPAQRAEVMQKEVVMQSEAVSSSEQEVVQQKVVSQKS